MTTHPPAATMKRKRKRKRKPYRARMWGAFVGGTLEDTSVGEPAPMAVFATRASAEDCGFGDIRALEVREIKRRSKSHDR